MTEHLHGYPPCATPAGQPCAPSDLAYEECKTHGALRGCEPSVVDGIPTGSYRCAHDDKTAASEAKKKPAKKAMKTKKAKAVPPARKAARKSAGKKGAKAKKAGASKKAKKAKPARKAKKASKAKAKPKKARRR